MSVARAGALTAVCVRLGPREPGNVAGLSGNLAHRADGDQSLAARLDGAPGRHRADHFETVIGLHPEAIRWTARADASLVSARVGPAAPLGRRFRQEMGRRKQRSACQPRRP